MDRHQEFLSCFHSARKRWARRMNQVSPYASICKVTRDTILVRGEPKRLCTLCARGWVSTLSFSNSTEPGACTGLFKGFYFLMDWTTRLLIEKENKVVQINDWVNVRGKLAEACLIMVDSFYLKTNFFLFGFVAQPVWPMCVHLLFPTLTSNSQAIKDGKERNGRTQGHVPRSCYSIIVFTSIATRIFNQKLHFNLPMQKHPSIILSSLFDLPFKRIFPSFILFTLTRFTICWTFSSLLFTGMQINIEFLLPWWNCLIGREI